jgi:hypothetical protein
MTKEIVTVVGDSEPAHLSMCDRLELDDAAKMEITSDGYLKATPRIARTGIQLYAGDECDRPDMAVVRVYRPQDSVFAGSAVRSYTNLPVTLDHPNQMVTPANWKDVTIGYTGEDVLRDGQAVRVPMMLRDADAIKTVRDGKKQLSVGYTCDLKWEDGTTPDGEKYDAIQTNIRANHLAVVAAARGGPTLAIGDDKPKWTFIQGEDHMTTLQKVMVDGVQVEMTDTAAQVVQRAMKAIQDSFDEFKKKAKEGEEEKEDSIKKLDAKIKEIEDASKAKDAQVATLTTQLAEAKDAVTPAKLQAHIVDLNNTTAKAKAIMGDKAALDGKNAAEIKRAVVDFKLKDAAKGWTDEMVSASFTSLTADVKLAEAQRATVDSSPGGIRPAVNLFAGPAQSVMTDAEKIKNDAYLEVSKRDQDAWKNPGAAA